VPVTPRIGRVLIDELIEDVVVDYRVNKRRSVVELEIRIQLHVLPFFRGRRSMAIPHLPTLKGSNVRTGFFKPEQLAAILKNLPKHVQPVIRFAYITGGRVPGEVMTLHGARSTSVQGW
jgi:hypothetical protein